MGALTLSQVTKSFGKTDVIKGVDLHVDDGEFCVFVGPSGCGKSTALRLIAGLMQPTTGKVIWHGDHDTGDLGVVFQEPTLMPWATVEQNVWLPLRLRGERLTESRPQIVQALDMVGLGSFAHAYPRELSGGMKMRVSIARALVTQPRMILMDEPFAALDEITRNRMNNDLLALRDRLGCTVIFVTHSVFESVYLSDRIVVMAPRPGRVAEEMTVTAPMRDEEFRTSAEYAAQCRAVSAALHRATGDA